MKKYICFLFVLLFIAHNGHAENPKGYVFTARTFNVPPEGGRLECSLEQPVNPELGKHQLVSGDIEILECIPNSPLVKSVTNTGCMFYVEIEMTDQDGLIFGEIPMSLKRTAKGEPVEVFDITLNYTQKYFPSSELFGGIIVFDGKGIYRPGAQPPSISSYRPALGGYLMLDGSGATYTWEKKSANDLEWTTMPGKTELTCCPDIMEGETVYYRRRAAKGEQVGYSNEVEILAELDAGLIFLSVADNGQYIYIRNKKNPSVAREYTRVEESTDLNNWKEIKTESFYTERAIPDRTTYFRRTAFTTTGETAHSNIVCYSLEEDVYISTKTAKNSSGSLYDEDIAYFDGLGRPSQAVSVSGSPSGKNLVTLYSYDLKGRQPNDYLPFAMETDSGPAKIGTDYLIGLQNQYYKTLYNSTSAVYPYIHREYDDSPLDRPVKTFRQGKEYQEQMDHFSENRYGLNSGDQTLRLTVGSGGSLVCERTPHDANTLHKTSLINEDGACEETFTDMAGRKILVRQRLSATEHADTYFVYDDLDRLRWVVSPEGSVRLKADSTWTLTSDNAEKYCYRYLYDKNGNVQTRHIPGKAPDNMTYDAVGRMITSQTGAMKAQKATLHYYYDPIGRLARVELQKKSNSHISPNPEPIGPIIPIDPVDPIDPIAPPIIINPDPEDPRNPDPFKPIIRPTSAAYSFGFGDTTDSAHDTERYTYDEYRLDTAAFSTHAFIPVAGVTGSESLCANVRGLKTHEEIFETFDTSVFASGAAAPASTRRTFYYDLRNRVIQSVETTPSDCRLRISYRYDYAGNILVRDEQHIRPGSDSIDIRYTYAYDDRGRQIREQTAINGAVQSDITSAYDDLGRLKTTQSDGAKLQTQYDYNIQGWLSRISHNRQIPPLLPGRPVSSEPFFSTSLIYFTPSESAPQYSGNIAQISWVRGMDINGSQFYSYSYDKLNRLTDAELYKTTLGIGGDRNIPENTYTERNMHYDLNGNMSSFERYNGDELYKYVYELSGNRIVSAKNCPGTRNGDTDVAYDETVAGSSYGYDTMGNLTLDGENNLTTAYNLLNLPQKITPTESHLQANMPFLAKYRYLWNGEKISAVDSQGNGYLYMGSVRYNLSGNEPVFESVPFSMGRIVREGNGYAARYFLTDHLGSVRTIADQAGTIIAEYDYLPYGKQHKNSSLATSDDNDFRYNGKELQERFGVDLYDSQARMQRFDGRFNSPDPLAGDFPSTSPYAYCAGNPINQIDPDGRVCTDYRNNKGELLFETEDGLKDIIIISNQNLGEFKEKLNEMDENATLDDAETNQEELHVMGINLDDWSEKSGGGYPTGDYDSDILYKGGYMNSYGQDIKIGRFKTIVQDVVTAISGFEESNQKSGHYFMGRSEGKRDKNNRILHKFNPKLKNNKPIITINNKKQAK